MNWQEKPCEAQLIEYDGGWECSLCGLSGGWHEFGDVWDEHIALPPCYSQSLDAAWQLVEHLDTIAVIHRFTNVDPAHVLYTCYLGAGQGDTAASSHTLPEAICIAALRCVGVEIDTTAEER
jgi:hypothetical protein